MSYYHHFNTYERAKIEELNKLGFSTRSIAKRLSRHHSSIARELLRFRRGKSYKAEVAHADYVAKRAYSKPKGKYSKELKDLVKEKLIATWSPEQIANTATLGKLGFKSIYRWIYDGRIDGVSMLILFSFKLILDLFQNPITPTHSYESHKLKICVYDACSACYGSDLETS